MRALAAACLLAVSWPAQAEPTTRLGVGGGVKLNLGVAGERYAPGYLLGVDAGVQFGWFGLAWSLWRAAYASSDPRSTIDGLETWQIDLGVRTRARIPFGIPTYGFVQLGASLLRASSPLPPDDDGAALGAQGGAGFELSLGQLQFGLISTAGLFPGGPTTVDVRLTVSFGRRPGKD
jgi:hypothetical protein